MPEAQPAGGSDRDVKSDPPETDESLRQTQSMRLDETAIHRIPSDQIGKSQAEGPQINRHSLRAQLRGSFLVICTDDQLGTADAATLIGRTKDGQKGSWNCDPGKELIEIDVRADDGRSVDTKPIVAISVKVRREGDQLIIRGATSVHNQPIVEPLKAAMLEARKRNKELAKAVSSSEKSESLARPHDTQPLAIGDLQESESSSTPDETGDFERAKSARRSGSSLRTILQPINRLEVSEEVEKVLFARLTARAAEIDRELAEKSEVEGRWAAGGSTEKEQHAKNWARWVLDLVEKVQEREAARAPNAVPKEASTFRPVAHTIQEILTPSAEPLVKSGAVRQGTADFLRTVRKKSGGLKLSSLMGSSPMKKFCSAVLKQWGTE